MDADFKEKPRLKIVEKRWSMNSQRLEEILAKLMRPIVDLRRSFDTDLSALLEEYLTEAGLHALDADENGESPAEPNFPELALLLQHSASVWGRKVDFLYQHVLEVSNSLCTTSSARDLLSAEGGVGGGDAETSPSRRRRRSSAGVGGSWTHIALESEGSARREAGPPRPPPTLPRVYLELEPRALLDSDRPLLDYVGEPVGLLQDFHVSGHLHHGLLRDVLEGPEPDRPPLRPIPLAELQAAIAARAPDPPPPALASPPPTPPRGNTPSSPTPAPVPPPAPPPPDHALHPTNRKRKSEVSRVEEVSQVKLQISEEVRARLSCSCEYSVPASWVSAVVGRRARDVREARRALDRDPAAPDFRGFEYCSLDVSGFAGWSGAPDTESALLAGRLARASCESDDDGFFEQSSLGESESSRVEEQQAGAAATGGGVGDWWAWRAGVVARAAASEARGGLDVRTECARVMSALPDTRPVPFTGVLAAVAREHTDVSRLFLAALFLANAGVVEVEGGAPLALDACSLRRVVGAADEVMVADT